MNDHRPSRLELLEFAERVAAQHLAQIRRWREVEQRQQAERAEGERRRPPAPEWLLEKGVDGRAATYVHVGSCWSGRKGARSQGITREQALQALTVDRTEPCPQCRPDTALGVLE
ncbi:DUF6233 domain-containing protein [Streptomyces spectabilis]|uniref:DUF6233 domain-containing protein n=1 Tax=Streptomyces spectabilis TaxID=68270 RepID=UPI0033E4B713